jgi:hypothetical protein
MTPRYTHDCKACQLFCVDSKGDWYVCPSPLGRSIIRRYGNEGPEYGSGGIAMCVEMTPLELAAVARGLELTQVEKDKLLTRFFDRMVDKMSVEELSRIYPDDDRLAWRGEDA